MSRTRIVVFLSLSILVGIFLVVLAFTLNAPKQQSLFISDEEVLNIGKEYVEETYGTDYAINGDVANLTYTS